MDRGDNFLECLQAAVDTAREAIIITEATLDAPGPRIVYSNSAFTRLTGYTAEEVRGKSPRLLQGLETDPAVTARLRRRLEAGRDFYGQAVNYRKDNTPFLMEWSVVPVCGEDAAVHHYVAVQREVTAAATAGEASPDETLHRQTFEQHTAVMLLIDPGTGAIIDANPAAEAYYGWSRDALRTMAITQINTLARTEVEREMAQAEYEQRNYFLFRHRLASGEERDVEVHSTPVVVDGRQHLHSIVHDVTERRRANEALAAAEARYRSVLGNLQEVVFETDTDGRWTFLSPAWASLTGHPVDASIGRPFSAFVGPEDDTPARALFAQLLAGERASVRREVLLPTTNGNQCWVEALARPRLAADEGTTSGVTGTLIDITERKQAQTAMQEGEERLRQIAANVPGVMCQIQFWPDSGHACMPYASERLRDLFGLDPADVRDDLAPFLAKFHPDDRERAEIGHRSKARTLVPWQAEFRVRRPGRDDYDWIESRATPQSMQDGSVLWHGLFTIVTERKQLEAELHRRSYYDLLTGLPNRSLFENRLEHAIARAKRGGHGLALLYLNLDGFKDINNAWGYRSGDYLLQSIAERLGDSLRQADTLARSGGDDFTLIVEPAANQTAAEAVASKLLTVLATPFEIEQRPIYIHASIGISVYPGDGGSTDLLLQQADAAMHRAKQLGGSQWAFFSSELRGDAEERITLSTDLKAAIECDALQLALQPVVALAGENVASAEALVRWRHASQGWISPARFIPIAESTGLIHDLGAWVLERACRHVAARDEGDPPRRIAVNVSVRQLRAPDFVERVRAILVRTGLAPQRLELELTESAFIDHTTEIVDRLETLRTDGVTVSVDDFGTGFSSLQYLKRLPIDRLKIDRSFISGIDDDGDNQAIVSAIITLARQFGLALTAEGIETAAEAECLRRLGCESGQGFYYARPALIGDDPHS